jgi:type I restriction enzyme S subunit
MSLKRIDELFNFEKGVLQSSKCVPGEYDFITASSEWKTHNEYTHDCEALIFAAAASGSLGRTHYVNGKFISSDLCFIITPKDQENLPVDLKFYHILFNELKDEIVRNTKAGTSKEAIGLGSFGKYQLPYFDIDTQIEIKNRFVNAEELKSELSGELSSQLDLVKKLRQQLLQDAVQGKLVEQNPQDEPAGELLKKIKAALRQAQGSKKIKELPPIKPEEIPFKIPENWVWCRLGEITTLLTDGKHGDSKDQKDSGYYFLSAKDIQNGKFIYDNARQITYEDFIETHRRTNLEPGDLCVVNTGATIGKTAFAPDNELTRKTTFQKSVAILKVLNHHTSMRFIEYFIIFETPKLLKTSRGSAINNLLLGDMKNVLFPMPPLKEQNRIVQKLDELMQYCNELEASIKQSESQNSTLLQQVLREALSLPRDFRGKEPVEA